jgi:hypothetical protein
MAINAASGVQTWMKARGLASCAVDCERDAKSGLHEESVEYCAVVTVVKDWDEPRP